VTFLFKADLEVHADDLDEAIRKAGVYILLSGSDDGHVSRPGETFVTEAGRYYVDDETSFQIALHPCEECGHARKSHAKIGAPLGRRWRGTCVARDTADKAARVARGSPASYAAICKCPAYRPRRGETALDNA
jgi:hypothetical protein